MLGAGAGIDDGFPGVVFRAEPPDLAAAPGRDLGGEQGAVQGGMPLGCDGWVEGRQVVEAWQDLPARAVGAAAVAPGAVGDGGAVAVAAVTKPPDPLVAAVGDSLRGQGRVACRVPLGEQCLSMVFRAEIK